MKTVAVRLYGENDIRLESFELPPINDDEALLRIITDSLCTSTYKAVCQGSKHKRVPEDVAENPVIIGHEMCGELVALGENLKANWKVGQRIIIQPALKLDNGHDPGYSYPYIGGAATYAVVPRIVLERGCMLPFAGEGAYKGSMVESIGCCLRGFKGLYHTDYTDYTRTDGAKVGGRIAILGGAGPMGLATAALAANYAGASVVTVVDINAERLAYAEKRFPPAKAVNCSLSYVNTTGCENPVEMLRELSGGGYDDVFVMVPVPALFTMAEEICREDGCVNFFAGPAKHDFPGSLNLYRVHYDGIHVVGTAGSIPEDTADTIKLIEDGVIDPSIAVSHILGLNAYADAIYAMEKPSGMKKVCYTHLDLPMVAIEDFAELGKTDPMFAELDRIVSANGGLWCAEAENYLLAHAPKIGEAAE
ncbi:MAG: zinc-binding dehydrogenase [Clostridia bacterium]|nr:zinc-binding dehydrogenase [Clostridia bacterium]